MVRMFQDLRTKFQVLSSFRKFVRMKKLFFFIVCLAATGFAIPLVTGTASAVPPADVPVEIKWYSLEEAQKLSDANPRKIFLDIGTSWCGWCKIMDANTFHNPTIAKYMNEHYYCVKFDAETHDTVTFNGQKFWNRGPATQRSTHDFAIQVLQGRLSYPSYAFISKDRKTFSIMMGYMAPEQFEPYVHFYGEDKELVMTYEEFLKTFKSELPPPAPAQQPQAPAPH
jgi:thioredoxin-related protein